MFLIFFFEILYFDPIRTLFILYTVIILFYIYFFDLPRIVMF